MTQKTSEQPIPIEALAAFPAPGMGAPNTFVFSLDNQRLMFLDTVSPDVPVQQLYMIDVATGERRVLIKPPGGGVSEEKLSPEEELRRQRERMLAVGLTHYSRAEKSERLLIPVAGSIYIYDNDSLQLIVDSTGQSPALNPSLSADGEWVAFVRDAEVYVVQAAGGNPVQVTSGARGTGKTNGLAEYIAQEELGRADGFWWSPDAEHIAYAEVDETHIPVYRIVHQGKDEVGEGAQEDHRYPFAGEANAHVKLAVIPRAGAEPVWMDLDFGEGIYLSRVFWWQDGSLGAECLNRVQNERYLVRFDIKTGTRVTILHETSDYWFYKSEDGFIGLEDGDFLWVSPINGFQHLYLYDNDGNLIRQLTDGEWIVDKIVGVHEGADTVYFSANLAHPTEQHLYAVSLNGGEIRQITDEPGTHETWIDAGGQYFVDKFSAVDTPPIITLRSLDDSSSLHVIHKTNDARIKAFDLSAPEIVSLRNRDGTLLYGAIYRPPAHFGPGPYPTVVHVYGGPGPQMVANHWKMTTALQLQYLRNMGFLVFRLDNRGSARRGLAFEGALKHCMGTVEVDDQVDGVNWLVEQGLTDPDRVGMFGWSYGGYMTLMCLAKAADTFKVGVAGAPVSHWDGYDTCYTERYMDTPQANPEGYEDGSVMAHVDKITGKLLLIHGMLDENVHFRHTARLVNALLHANKDYDLILFPDERHMPRRAADRIYLNTRIVRYFEEHL